MPCADSEGSLRKTCTERLPSLAPYAASLCLLRQSNARYLHFSACFLCPVQLPAGSSGRAALWRQLHSSQLLEVVGRCLADVGAAGLHHEQAMEALHLPCEVGLSVKPVIDHFRMYCSTIALYCTIAALGEAVVLPLSRHCDQLLQCAQAFSLLTQIRAGCPIGQIVKNIGLYFLGR